MTCTVSNRTPPSFHLEVVSDKTRITSITHRVNICMFLGQLSAVLNDCLQMRKTVSHFEDLVELDCILNHENIGFTIISHKVTCFRGVCRVDTSCKTPGSTKYRFRRLYHRKTTNFLLHRPVFVLNLWQVDHDILDNVDVWLWILNPTDILSSINILN